MTASRNSSTEIAKHVAAFAKACFIMKGITREPVQLSDATLVTLRNDIQHILERENTSKKEGDRGRRETEPAESEQTTQARDDSQAGLGLNTANPHLRAEIQRMSIYRSGMLEKNTDLKLGTITRQPLQFSHPRVPVAKMIKNLTNKPTQDHESSKAAEVQGGGYEVVQVQNRPDIRQPIIQNSHERTLADLASKTHDDDHHELYRDPTPPQILRSESPEPEFIVREELIQSFVEQGHFFDTLKAKVNSDKEAVAAKETSIQNLELDIEALHQRLQKEKTSMSDQKRKFGELEADVKVAGQRAKALRKKMTDMEVGYAMAIKMGRGKL